VSISLLLALCLFKEQVELQYSTALQHTSLPPLPQIPTREPKKLFFFLPLYVVMAEAASKNKCDVRQKQSGRVISLLLVMCCVASPLAASNVDCIAFF